MTKRLKAGERDGGSEKKEERKETRVVLHAVSIIMDPLRILKAMDPYSENMHKISHTIF